MGMSISYVITILVIWGIITGIDNYSIKSLLGIMPLITGFFVGLLLGNIALGAYIGAYIQLLSLGLIEIGGAVPPDFAIVAAITAAVFIYGGLDLSMLPLVVLSLIPAGIVMMYLEILARTINVSLIRKAESLIDMGQIDSVGRLHFLGLLPLAGFRGALYGISAYIVLKWGIDVLKSVLETLPVWFLRSLSVAGAVLPALGLGILLSYIGVARRYHLLLIPFLIVSLIVIIDITVVFTILIVIASVVAWVRLRKYAKGSVSSLGEGKGRLDRSLLRKIAIRSGFFLECSWNYERMQALGYLFSILPALKRIYKDEEELKKAARVHLEFFNTNPFLTPILVGVNVAIEESSPRNFELVRSLKTGLMGAFAGIGDSLIFFVIGGILLIMGSTLSLMSLERPLYALAPLIILIVFDAIFIPFRVIGSEFGYKRGMRITESFSGEKIQSLREIFEWLSIVSIGAIIPFITAIRVVPLATFLARIEAKLAIISINQFLGASIMLILTLLMKNLYGKGYGPTRLFLLLFAIGFILGTIGLVGTIGQVAVST
ncbi:MAG: PTS system mannose/fructose/sorbose family transporter subunit IID [Candidatus Njordarchaeales archaeon]